MATPTRSCKNCSESFTVRPEDAAYYEKIGVPWPTWCPRCRGVRRHGHINDYVFYTRRCNGCEKSFVSIFPPGADYRVFCQECFYAENREDKLEGREWDPSRSFFEQFDELMHAAPQMGIIGRNNQNCDYCESVANCKDCYLISECSNCEDCLYSYWIQKTVSSIDCCYTHECERCYELADCFNCYNLLYSANCSQCSDSYFLEGCTGCSDCVGCTNLRHKRFHIFNKPFNESAYRTEVQKLNLDSRSGITAFRGKFERFLVAQPRKALQVHNIENCHGDYVRNAKNCHHVFHCYDAEDCAYGEHVWRGARFCFDANTAGRAAEWIYECTNCGIDTNNVKFCRYCWSSVDIEYCNQCFSGKNLFGCVSLKPGSEYCILNRQYSRDEYEQLLPKIKAKMIEDGEYGEFFPLAISLFGFNNTVSFDEGWYTEAEIRASGWKWESEQPGTKNKETISIDSIAPLVSAVPDSILKEVLSCSECARNYRLTARELAFYRSQNIPVPIVCFDCRHRSRLARRNPKLFRQIHCSACRNQTLTTLPAGRFNNIVCPSCYEKIVN